METKTTDRRVQFLNRAALISLCALVVCVLALPTPASYWPTVVSWAIASLLLIARFFRQRRAPPPPLYYALLIFFVLTLVSSICSYERALSLRSMDIHLSLTIVYLVAEGVTSQFGLRLLTGLLIGACLVSVGYTIGERIVGFGVKITGLRPDSPLAGAGIKDGDTLLVLDGKNLWRPEELERALESSDSNPHPAQVYIYRFEWYHMYSVPRGTLLTGTTPLERLGIANWSRGREWRALGFYLDYTIFAEILQLIASIALGLFLALRRKRTLLGTALALSVGGMSLALLLTITRGSWLAFLVSAFVMVLISSSRRAVISLMLITMFVAPAALYFLQQKRNVRFYDRTDGAITWRETVYRESLQLLFSKPRHLLVGVGINSINERWPEWGLFDRGRQPPSHLHSTPLSIAVERGIPALIAWLCIIVLYSRLLLNLWRSKQVQEGFERGLILGAIGSLAGFFLSGLVNYNLGHWQVSSIFYVIMGLTLVVERFRQERNATLRHAAHSMRVSTAEARTAVAGT